MAGNFKGGPSVSVFNPGYAPRVDSTLATRENVLVQRNASNTQNDLPLRPAYGKHGDRVILWTNYYGLDVPKTAGFVEYNVVIVRKRNEDRPESNRPESTPKPLPKDIVKRIIELLLLRLRSLGVVAVSDFVNTLISLQSISEQHLSHSITYIHTGETQPENNAPRYDVTLTLTGHRNMQHLLDYNLTANGAVTLEEGQALLQTMNIIIGQGPKTDPNVKTVARNMHVLTITGTPADRADLHGGLLALRAYAYSVRASTERLILNVQVKNLPFYSPVRLDHTATEFLGRRGSTNQALESFLRRLSVETTHIQRRSGSGRPIPQYKTISALAHLGDGATQAHPPRVPRSGASAREVQFWQDAPPEQSSKDGPGKRSNAKSKLKHIPSADPGGNYISVLDYFRQYHQITLTKPDLPVINVGDANNPVYLPMEVCVVRPGQLFRTQIDAAQTKDMLTFAVRKPSQNAESIRTTGFTIIGNRPTAQLGAFNITVKQQLLTVPGRYLPAPVPSYDKPVSAKNAQWTLEGLKLRVSTALTAWRAVVIMTNSSRRPWPAQEDATYLDNFAAGLRSTGIRVGPQTEKPLEIVTDIEDREDRIAAAISEIKGDDNAENRKTFLLVILPDSKYEKTSTLYNKVKWHCDVRIGVQNQCVNAVKFRTGNKAYFANVALKINLKLGGVNQSIANVELGGIRPDTTMFVGIDVTHPAPGAPEGTPSLAAIVSSIDGRMAQWPAALASQKGKEEMTNSALKLLLKHQLGLWLDRNRTLPERLVFYRDGVSEGQYHDVLEFEKTEIIAALREMYQTTSALPPIAIIIVGKRHHTRFYPTAAKDASRNGNPKNGLVVDRVVTQVGNWDFFLQAHAPIKGTAKPAHYYVVYDEIFKKAARVHGGNNTAADNLEQLTHGLCYLFGRATTAVSVCPPAYYADLACERARCFLAVCRGLPPHGMLRVAPNLRHTMWYI